MFGRLGLKASPLARVVLGLKFETSGLGLKVFPPSHGSFRVKV